MDYDDLVKDFASRTLENLNYIQKQKNQDSHIYEVTQLINSLLGIIVFPRARILEKIPKTSLDELHCQGWPIINNICKNNSIPVDYDDLGDLLYLLRNAVSHSNIEFLTDDDNEITGIYLWNCEGTPEHHQNRNSSYENWQIKLGIEELTELLYKFEELIEKL